MKSILSALLISIVLSKCTLWEGACSTIYKTTVQFNTDLKGVPTYIDSLTSQYSSGCRIRYYTVLYHSTLVCRNNDETTHDCTSTIDSAWIRIWNATREYKDLVDNCGKALTEAYQNVMTYKCVIDGVDQWGEVKMTLGTTSTSIYKIKDGQPVSIGDYYLSKEACTWEYEIEGIWSTLVITIVSIAVGVVLILFIVLVIYTQRHRKEKRSGMKSLYEDKELKEKLNVV